MRFHPVKWRKDGFGLKLVDLPTIWSTEMTTGYYCKTSLVCRYWQIWATVNGERMVVDRALTYRKALTRINHLKNTGVPLTLQKVA